MRKIKLGKSGLEVNAPGLGCMGMSEFYGERQAEKESIRTLHYALDQGVSFWDTADMYGPHLNEQLLGKAIRQSSLSRDNMTVSTKFGVVREDDPFTRHIDGRPEYVKRACENSLKRLNLEYIDLYYMHRLDPQTDIEETVAAMAELVKEGKVRYLGLSEVSASTLKRACEIHPISALQSEYSLWSRDVERDILPACIEAGVGFVAYSPLGRGFLTSTITQQSDLKPGDWRLQNPRFSKENLSKNCLLLEDIQGLSQELGCTSAQLALAWLMHKGEFIAPIPGTTKTQRIDENIAAMNLKLTVDQLNILDSILPEEGVSGQRYDSEQMALIANS